MDRIALLEQQIAALKEQRESIAELREQYLGFVDETRKLRVALRLIDDILSGPDDWAGIRKTASQRMALACDVVQKAPGDR